jgi:hypothetical protein
VFGSRNIAKLHYNALQTIQTTPRDAHNESHTLSLPMLVGEFGLPFDLNSKKMLKKRDFGLADAALGSYYAVFDKLEISSTQWNYGTENQDDL